MGGLNIVHTNKEGKKKGEIKVFRDSSGSHKEFVDEIGNSKTFTGELIKKKGG